jgi:hypothetical protein
MPSELWAWDALDIAAAIRLGTVSAREVTEAALARLAAVNPALNAVVEPLPDSALAAAAAVDAARTRGEALPPLAQHRHGSFRGTVCAEVDIQQYLEILYPVWGAACHAAALAAEAADEQEAGSGGQQLQGGGLRGSGMPQKKQPRGMMPLRFLQWMLEHAANQEAEEVAASERGLAPLTQEEEEEEVPGATQRY